MNRIHTPVILVILTACACGCESVNRLVKQAGTRTQEAEVAPGQFVTYQEHLIVWELEDGSWEGVHGRRTEKAKPHQKDSSTLVIPWQGGEVRWTGVGVPITLRAWNEQLYLITFDRETDFSKIRFRYYRQDSATLVEMPAAQFPKQIATQNLWLKTHNGFRPDRTVINDLQIARDLDPADRCFRSSLTAKIWMQLETGREFYEIHNVVTPEQAFLEGYLKQHNVVKLTQIQR